MNDNSWQTEARSRRAALLTPQSFGPKPVLAATLRALAGSDGALSGPRMKLTLYRSPPPVDNGRQGAELGLFSVWLKAESRVRQDALGARFVTSLVGGSRSTLRLHSAYVATVA